MKVVYTIILVTLYNLCLFAQQPATVWAKSFGGSETEYAHSITTDASGNVYMIATFNSTVLTVGNMTFTNTGGEDILVAKHDPNGALIWAKQIGSLGDDYGYGIATDAGNNVYITGAFNSTTITFGTNTFTNAGGQDIYLAKLSPTGDHVWAICAGSAAIERPTSIATDSNGNVYFTGYFASTCVFGTTSLTPTSNYDAFLAKYSPTGNCLWAKAATGTIYTGFNSLCTDANGNAIVVGEFESSTVDFGGVTLNNVSAYHDAFVAKYDPSGSVMWAQGIQGPEDDFASSVTTDGNSNVIVGGRFFSSTLTVGGHTLIRSGQENAFISKFSPNGTSLWANSINGITNEMCTTVSCDVAGNITLGGIMSSSTLAIGANTYTNTGVYDFFLVNYSAAGNILWSKKIGGSGMDYIQSIRSDLNANIFVTGYSTSNSLAFDANTLVNPNDSTFDIFLAKISTATELKEVLGEGSVNISPNPFSDFCSVDFDSYQENVLITFFDMTGREMKKIKYSGTQYSFSKGDLNTGVYFIKITDAANNSLTRKLIIQ